MARQVDARLRQVDADSEVGMPCYGPLKAYRGYRNGNGKRPLVFSRNKADPALGFAMIKIACGQCIGCRLERSRQWAMRCVHEAQMYERNCFITLTYNDASLEDYRARGIDADYRYSVNVREFQLFMKRLRKKFGSGIRVFYCGEYGMSYGRPHYHAVLFNHDFEDKVLWQKRDEVLLYRSASLECLWPFGYSSVGAVTFQSSAYVARYILKKVTGNPSLKHYERICPHTGMIFQRLPEFAQMSNGVGKAWYEKYKSDCYPHDRVYVNDSWQRPPRYYDELYQLEEPEKWSAIKARREAVGDVHRDDQTSRRLLDKETVKRSRLSMLQRGYDQES